MLRTVVVTALALALTGCGPKREREAPKALSQSVSFGAIWDDPLRCAEVVRGGRRLKKAADKLRVGTWNIRWFPDGGPEDKAHRNATDVPWLACIIAYIDVDVLGLQEIKLTDRGREALAVLTRELRRLTDAKWKWVADGCEADSRQHVLILYRDDRVILTEVVSHGELDPTAREGYDPACPGFLRPGLGAYVTSKGGGVDFHFITAHLDAGRSKRDFKNRKKTWELIDVVSAKRMAQVADEDLIVAADFNLMGCRGCEVENWRDELALLRETVGRLSRPLVVPEGSHACTEYYRGRPHVIDKIIYARDMQEAEGAIEYVSGVCGAGKCRELPEDLPVLKRISDHCPLLMDLRDEDLDSGVAASR